MITMENKDNFEELQLLKQQMSVLKKQLDKETIIADDQIEKVAKKYTIGTPWTNIVLGIALAFNLSLYLCRYFFEPETLNTWRYILLFGFLALIFAYLFCFPLNAGFSYWQIVNGELQRCFRFPQRVKKSIPVSSILYIEKLRKHRYFSPLHGFSIHIRYNKYDDLYLNPNNLNDFICDLIRANPDIELRQEK